ncbi:hypothetical protein CsSME_00034572 [Camellia sinensis var. sinensis]
MGIGMKSNIYGLASYRQGRILSGSSPLDKLLSFPLFICTHSLHMILMRAVSSPPKKYYLHFLFIMNGHFGVVSQYVDEMN